MAVAGTICLRTGKTDTDVQGVRTLTHASASFSQSQTLITAYGQGGKANLFGTTASSLAGGVTTLHRSLPTKQEMPSNILWLLKEMSFTLKPSKCGQSQSQDQRRGNTSTDF